MILSEGSDTQLTTISHPLIGPEQLRRDVVLYLRQSSPGQVEENWGSRERQRDLIHVIQRYGWRPDQITVIEDDLGKSARSAAGRTGWEEMLRLLTTGTIGCVATLNISRLARALINFEELRILAKHMGAVLLLEGRPADPSDPNDTALLQVQAVFAQLDNDGRTKHLQLSKLRKAQDGATVSLLPIGWVKNPDGSFEFDPEVRAAIDEVYMVFREIRTLRGTVAELNRRNRRLPSRYRRGKVQWRRASIEVVWRFITKEAYAGVYVYGCSDSRPAYGLDAKGQPRRRRLPKSEWIRHEAHHPAYITPEEQREFLEYLRRNRFEHRDRPSKGTALGQGLLECGICGSTMTVQYAKRGSDRYQCTARSAQYADPPCFSITGRELDRSVEKAFLDRVGNPILEIYENALCELRKSEDLRKQRLETERKRLEYEERIAQDRYEQVDPRNRLVAARLEERLNDAIGTRLEFERQVVTNRSVTAVPGLDEALGRLRNLVPDVESLWRHPDLTHREKKEMLQCLIERIVVNRTKVAIEAEVKWFDGTSSSIRLLHLGGIRERVRELHAEGLIARQIRDRLAAGDPTTGQKWEYTVTHIYQILKRLGLRPNSVQTAMKPLQAELDELYSRGLTLAEIADRVNSSGRRTSRGQAWTPNAVCYWLSRWKRRSHLEQLHRELLADAKRRGLTNKQAAQEFNQKGIPRAGGGEWTADAVRQRRVHVNRHPAKRKVLR